MFFKRFFKSKKPLEIENKDLGIKNDVDLLKAGEVLNDRYQINSQLSDNTCLATDTHGIEKLVIIKHIEFNSTNNSSLKKANDCFDREMLDLTKLSETCSVIPKLIDYFIVPDRDVSFYLVLEYIEGENIIKELSDIKISSDLSTARLLKKILLKLKVLHDRGVIHDAIDPSHILRRDTDREVFILYHGNIEKSFQNILWDEIRNDRISMHTGFDYPVFSYRSPESMAHRPSFSSDIYAVGWIGVQSLIDVPLKDISVGLNPWEIQWNKHCTVDSKLAIILAKMTEVSVRYRYQNVNEVLEDINLLI
jgi:eukaryotic-like serine/threonine-protein kinase